MQPDCSADEYLTLSEATRHAPGRPHSSCMWRWCRKGVLARGGQRIRLQHVRAGGTIFTTRTWIEQFLAAIAEADTAYFDKKSGAAERLPPRDPPYGPPKRRLRNSRRQPEPTDAARLAAIERELDEAGI